jgi:DNA-binding NarL/FixJ family response regulator
MKSDTFLLVGYLEFLPGETGFISPVFKCDNELFIQTINGEGAIDGFVPVPVATEYVPYPSRLTVRLGSPCLFGFKMEKVKIDNYNNMVAYFVNNILTKRLADNVKDCINGFVGLNFNFRVDEVHRLNRDAGKEIRVAIADDNKMFLNGLILSLRPYKHIRVVQQAGNGQELLDGIAESRPDIVLMDLRMPVKDGIETTKEIAGKYPDIHVVALTMYDDERFVSHMLEIGANGYLLKSANPHEIIEALNSVITKGYYLNDFVNRILLKKNAARIKVGPELNQKVILTDAERELIKYLIMEFSVQEIAKIMKTSANNINAIKDKLMDRFGTKSTPGLVFYAVKNNLID